MKEQTVQELYHTFPRTIYMISDIQPYHSRIDWLEQDTTLHLDLSISVADDLEDLQATANVN